MVSILSEGPGSGEIKERTPIRDLDDSVVDVLRTTGYGTKATGQAGSELVLSSSGRRLLERFERSGSPPPALEPLLRLLGEVASTPSYRAMHEAL